jgi:hypothetical protein
MLGGGKHKPDAGKLTHHQKGDANLNSSNRQECPFDLYENKPRKFAESRQITSKKIAGTLPPTLLSGAMCQPGGITSGLPVTGDKPSLSSTL